MLTADPYMTRAVEYLTCVGFVVFFTLFWRFVASEPVLAAARAVVHQFGWFQLPEGLHFHAGHAWARQERDDVTVGVDDFAQQLVGPVAAVTLPRVGDTVTAGLPAWALEADAKSVPMLAPVSGTVVAINESAIAHPELLNEDPYGNGWLVKVRVSKPAEAMRALFSGETARAWIEDVSERLMGSMTPELGHLCQDGGVPVHGIARAMDPVRWDEVARRFLLS